MSPHLEIHVIPQVEDALAAAEAALSGRDIRKKMKRKIMAVKPHVPLVTSLSLTREETPEPEDPAPLSCRTKRRYDPVLVSGISPRASLRLKYASGKSKAPPGTSSGFPQLTIDLERTPSPSSTDLDVTAPPFSPEQTPPSIPPPTVEVSPTVRSELAHSCV